MPDAGPQRKPSIAGHRGAAGTAPENTLTSFLAAAALGIPWVELDVRLSRDEVPVVFHDDRLDRVTPERGRVDERSWEELSRIPVLPGAFGGRYPDARIPSLEQVLTSLPAGCGILAELKSDPERPERLVRRALETLAPHVERLRILSFDWDLLRAVRVASPGVALGVLASQRQLEAALDAATELRAAAIHAPHGLLTPEWHLRARNAGFLVNAWTVNTAEDMQRLAGLGVVEITTDYPELALRVL
ncbi:MAG TPA: glycerophosphodiester phosphodiesterase family protein [Armatimonadota bacterium]|nr:glycerophosphodiester phosphodiesterase family protein [Armatimonadota bacterium]